MSDSDYIPPIDRELLAADAARGPHVGQKYFYDPLPDVLESHAVSDSIASDLATALRESRNLYDRSPKESIRKFEQWRQMAETVLARFDATIGNKP